MTFDPHNLLTTVAVVKGLSNLNKLTTLIIELSANKVGDNPVKEIANKIIHLT